MISSDTAGVNLAILSGTTTSEPLRRELPSGSTVVQFDVSTPVGGAEPSTTVAVPVAWHDPPKGGLDRLALGEEVVVVGTVRRRFFRAGGATQSRTEVVAEHVVLRRRVKTVQKVVDAAIAELRGRVS